MKDFDDSQEDQVRLNPPAGRASLVGILYYPDILDLRFAGYELERFEGLNAAEAHPVSMFTCCMPKKMAAR